MATAIHIKQAFKNSFALLYKNLPFLAMLLATYIASLIGLKIVLPSIIEWVLGVEPTLEAFSMLSAYQIAMLLLFMFCSFMAQSLLVLGTTHILLELHDGNQSSLKELFTSYRILMPYVIASSLFFCGSFISLLLLIVPGLIFITFYYFYDIIIVDQRCSALEAFHISRKLTRNVEWQLFLFIGLNFLLTIISFGLLYPVLLMARIDIYKRLRTAKGL